MGRLFGTFGVRGIANEKITPEFALKLGMAFGTLLKREGREKPLVVIGTDTRVSGGEMLKDAFISGLLSVGCDVVDVGIAPTPGDTVRYGPLWSGRWSGGNRQPQSPRSTTA